jgi:hypothetical protein
MLGEMIDAKLGNMYMRAEFTRVLNLLDNGVENAIERIFFVSGDLDHVFFSGKPGKAISDFLDNKPFSNCYLLFHKDGCSKEDMIEKTRKDNYFFLRELSKTSEEGMQRLHFYVSGKRPDNHFAVCDSFVYIESHHKKGENPITFIKNNSVYLADRYVKDFNKMVENSSDVQKIDACELLEQKVLV